MKTLTLNRRRYRVDPSTVTTDCGQIMTSRAHVEYFNETLGVWRECQNFSSRRVVCELTHEDPQP